MNASTTCDPMKPAPPVTMTRPPARLWDDAAATAGSYQGRATIGAPMARPLTVLFVVPSLGLGGVERSLTSVLERLDRERFNPTLCVLGDATGALKPPADVAEYAKG